MKNNNDNDDNDVIILLSIEQEFLLCFNFSYSRLKCNEGNGSTPLYVNVHMNSGQTANLWVDALSASFAGVQVTIGDFFTRLVLKYCGGLVTNYTIHRVYSRVQLCGITAIRKKTLLKRMFFRQHRYLSPWEGVWRFLVGIIWFLGEDGGGGVQSL